MAEYQHVAALGSSFAAGPGIPPIVDRAAGRSGRNYAHLLADRLGARLTDLTVSGATTGTIVDTPQRPRPGRRFPPQVHGLPLDADLVTVTAGGNDLGYAAGMLRAALAGWLRGRAPLRPVGGLLARGAVPRVGPDEVRAATDGLVRVVDAVQRRVPQARVVLVGYLSVFGADTAPGREVPLSSAEIAQFRRIGELLAGAFAAAAERTGAELLPVAELSAGHALGSAEPWVTGFRMRAAPFHPNAAGMRAVADELHRLVTA